MTLVHEKRQFSMDQNWKWSDQFRNDCQYYRFFFQIAVSDGVFVLSVESRDSTALVDVHIIKIPQKHPLQRVHLIKMHVNDWKYKTTVY
jgi:hypothetical protein